MNRKLFVLFISLTCFASFGVLQAQTPSGYSVTCDNGASFDNGVEIVVNQMRSGFNYTATAVGLNGFDPVLAVLDTNSRQGLCSDDESSARRYAANLPSSGNVPASNLSSQVTFSQGSGNAFADISLVVGGFGNASGEFLLILEGMAVTSGDGIGDVFSINVTPGVVASGVPLSLYMLARGDGQVDTYINEIDANGNTIVDNAGNAITCDDAGNSGLCWGNSVNLSNSSVTINTGTLPGWQYDSMLSFDLSNFNLSSDREQNFLNFAMSSSPSVSSEGQYLLVFHVGQTDAVPANNNGGGNNNGGNNSGGSSGGSTGGTESGGGTNSNTNTNTNQQNTSTDSAVGMSVTCDDGTTFDNGIEVILYDLPAGVSYTVTAVGVNGFDPILAVLEAETGEGGCNDDSEDAAGYGGNLPTSGDVQPSNLSSQVSFTPPGNGTVNASLVVGGFNNNNGDFLLIVEGTSIDSGETTVGDAISVNLTPAMIENGAGFAVYMVTAAGSNLDPYLVQTDSNLTPLTDSKGSPVACDNSGTAPCNSTPDLTDFDVYLDGNSLPGWDLDSMLEVAVRGITLDAERTQNYMTFVANAAPSSSNLGNYILVFHVQAS